MLKLKMSKEAIEHVVVLASGPTTAGAMASALTDQIISVVIAVAAGSVVTFFLSMWIGWRKPVAQLQKLDKEKNEAIAEMRIQIGQALEHAHAEKALKSEVLTAITTMTTRIDGLYELLAKK